MDQKFGYICFDVEARGKSKERNGLIAVGAVVANSDGQVMARLLWKIQPLQGQQMDEKCYSEFWSKNAETLQTLTSGDLWEPSNFAVNFRQFLDDWDKYFGGLYLLCDNPAFDAAYIDYYLDKFQLSPMQYDVNGNYRLVHDSDEYARGYLKTKDQWISSDKVMKDLDLKPFHVDGVPHMPDYDAEKILKFHLALLN